MLLSHPRVVKVQLLLQVLEADPEVVQDQAAVLALVQALVLVLDQEVEVVLVVAQVVALARVLARVLVQVLAQARAVVLDLGQVAVQEAVQAADQAADQAVVLALLLAPPLAPALCRLLAPAAYLLQTPALDLAAAVAAALLHLDLELDLVPALPQVQDLVQPTMSLLVRVLAAPAMPLHLPLVLLLVQDPTTPSRHRSLLLDQAAVNTLVRQTRPLSRSQLSLLLSLGLCAWCCNGLKMDSVALQLEEFILASGSGWNSRSESLPQKHASTRAGGIMELLGSGTLLCKLHCHRIVLRR